MIDWFGAGEGQARSLRRVGLKVDEQMRRCYGTIVSSDLKQENRP